MKLVLLAGQSNMAGRGIAGPDDLTEIPGLMMLGKDLKWRPAVENVHKDRNFVGTFKRNADGSIGEKVLGASPYDIVLPGEGEVTVGVGPGRTFGRLLLEDNPGCEVGLVPTAVGGTPISAWQPGGVDPHDPANHPYDDAIAMAREAQKRGEIVAVLWHQGEGDTGGPTPDFKAQLKNTIACFRRDLGLGEAVPFILGELASFYTLIEKSAADHIDRLMYEVVSEVRGTAIVPAKDLTHRGDSLHFDTASAHELGRRYYAMYKQMTS